MVLNQPVRPHYQNILHVLTSHQDLLFPAYQHNHDVLHDISNPHKRLPVRKVPEFNWPRHSNIQLHRCFRLNKFDPRIYQQRRAVGKIQKMVHLLLPPDRWLCVHKIPDLLKPIILTTLIQPRVQVQRLPGHFIHRLVLLLPCPNRHTNVDNNIWHTVLDRQIYIIQA